MNSITTILSKVCDLVDQNLHLIESTRYDITIKEDGTPVTKSDVFVEELIKKFILGEVPEALFIGEESFKNSTIGENEYIVLLDPIDGTENFCSGLKEWGLSLGIWNQGTHQASLLYLPEMGIKLMTGGEIRPVRSRITGLSSSMSQSIVDKLLTPGEYRIMGCAVYNIYNVIRGSYRSFENPKGAYAWDFLPGALLALEHGCSVQVDGEKFYGGFLDPRKKYTFRIDSQQS